MRWMLFISIIITLSVTGQGRLNISENTYQLDNHKYWIVDSTEHLYTVSRNGYLGLANDMGQIVIDAQFDVIEPFKHEVTVVASGGLYGIINNKGEVLAPCEYETIKPFHSSVSAFKKVDQWGMDVINSDGSIISSNSYWHLSSFHEGMGVGLNQNGDYFLVDSTGKEQFIINRYAKGLDSRIKNELFDMTFTYKIESYKLPLYKYENGIARGINTETLKYCFVDKENNPLFDKDFEYILPFAGNYAAVKTEKGWNYIDRNGNYKSETWYPSLAVNGSSMIIKKDDHYGVLDSNDKVLIPFKYLAITTLTDSLFAVCKENRWGEGAKWGVINLKNKTILPCIYEGIRFDLKTGIGKAGIYDNSVSLNTGVPRYTYYGHYFLFDHTGIIDKKKYPYSMLVVGISDWHKPGSFGLEGYASFAPPLDVHSNGFTITEMSKSSPLSITPGSLNKKMVVTNKNGKEIISGSFFNVDVYRTCIIARDQNHSIIYDHFGNRLFKTKYSILDSRENGTFRMFTGSGSGNEFIDAHGNRID